MRFATKEELIRRIEHEHRALVELLDGVPEERFGEAGVWGDGWTLDDLLAHLTEWEQMFLGWYRTGLSGAVPDLPAPGYKWNQTPELNRAIWSRHRDDSHRRLGEAFAASYEEILGVARSLTEEELLAPGHFAWTGAHPLATYLAPNTASHYRTAAKIVKRWLRGVRRPAPDRAAGSAGTDAPAGRGR